MAFTKLIVASVSLSAVAAKSSPGALSEWQTNFDVSVYESIPSFGDATTKFFGLPEGTRTSLFNDFRTMVDKFDLQDIVGIDIKHKHFNMPDGHVLCEEPFFTEGKSIMKPESLDNMSAMVPFNFALRNGTWKPYEFVKKSASAVERLEKVAANSHFLSDMADMIQHSGLSDVLGFQVMNRDHLPPSNGSVETPGEGENELLIRSGTGDLPHDMNDTKQVMWSFPGPSDGAPCPRQRPNWCNHGCRGHCRRH